MSKRYGRNQKRKHREAIDQLNNELSIAQRKNFNINIKYEKLKSEVENWNNQIISLLSIDSAFSAELNHRKYRHFPELLPIDQRISAVSLLSVMLNATAEIPYVRLVRFLLTLSEEHLIQFRRVITLTMSTGKQFCYAMDEQISRNVKKDIRFKHYLAKEIAEQFVRMI